MDLRRGFGILPVLAVFCVLAGGLDCTGIRTWTDAGRDFLDGGTNGTSARIGMVTLGFDQPAPDRWERAHPGMPRARAFYASGFDAKNGVLVMFGGLLDDTWTYNGSKNAWKNMYPNIGTSSPRPSVRREASMAYDGRSGVMIMFGGADPPNGRYYDETWTYNFNLNKWEQRLNSSHPKARYGAGMAYDESNGVIVMFGGSDASSYFGDTWSYNLSNNTWTSLKPAIAPSPRVRSRMVYDPARNGTILYGGQDASGAYSETWYYYYNNNTWIQFKPGASPPARYSAMTYDRDNGQVLSLHYNTSSNLNEMWAFDSASIKWAQRNPAGMPTPRTGCGMDYDSVNKAAVVFGGYFLGAYLNDTWTYDAASDAWTDTTTPAAPRADQQSPLSYDSQNDLVVFFRNSDRDGFWTPETWTYDLKTNLWRNMAPPAMPPLSSGHEMVYDSASGVIVLFGGQHYNLTYSHETWIYDAGANRWTNRTGAVFPYERAGHAMTYDTRSGLVVLFGGVTKYDEVCELGDTWTYDIRTNAWKNVTGAVSPPPRYWHDMAYDSVNNVSVLFGGHGTHDLLDDTWTFDAMSSTWKDMAPPSHPGTNQLHALAFDGLHGRSVLFGGQGYRAGCATWEYELASNRWTEATFPVNPEPRGGHDLVYCDMHDAFVLFGGKWSTYYMGDVWVLGRKDFAPAGTFTSRMFDAGGEACFGRISWNASSLPSQEVKVQLRSARPGEDILARDFTGPDGTAATYYSIGQNLHSGVNGSRWLQYRAYLGSSDRTTTPVLRSVTVRYNLVHNVTITAPRPDDELDGTAEIAWNASDIDNDTIRFSIHLLQGSSDDLLDWGLPSACRSWTWDTSEIPDGRYRIKIVAEDANSEIPLTVAATSGEFSIKHTPPNTPPVVSLIAPAHNSMVTGPEVVLSWNGADAEGDHVNYTVFLSEKWFDISSLPAPLLVTDNSSCLAAWLADGAMYRWSVIPNDGKENGTMPTARAFTVRIPPANRPPVASLLEPADNAEVASASVNLSWTGSDPDSDPICYFVMVSSSPFDEGSAPPPMAFLCETGFRLDNLTNGSTYHWAVVPNDGKLNGTVAGPRRFNVIAGSGNHPPKITSLPVLKAVLGQEYVYRITATDVDGDAVFFELVSRPDGALINRTTGRLAWTPAPSQRGDWQFIIRAVDAKGGYDEQRFLVSVDEILVGPTCRISSHSNGSRVSGVVVISGTAGKGGAPISIVQIRVDGGAWRTASGTENWSYRLDTTRLGNGGHAIGARAYDGSSYSDIVSVDVTVDNPVSSIPSWVVAAAAAVLVLAVAVAVLLFIRMRRKNGGRAGH